MRMTDLRAGWDVVGNEGGRIGRVEVVGQNYIRTARPGFASDLYIPVTFVANVEDQVVHLSLPKDDADQMGWEKSPRDDDTLAADQEGDLHRHF